MNDIVSLVQGNASSCNAKASQFSQGVVAFLATIHVHITKPELFYWKLCLVSEKTAVLTPYIVILITVTTITGARTWVGHPACAPTTVRWRSAPVRHHCGITWHPPGVSTSKYPWMITLVLNKLLTLWRDSGETCQLRHACVLGNFFKKPRLG